MSQEKGFFYKLHAERVAAILFIITFSVVCLIYFSSFLQPLILALLLWYFLHELKRFARKIKIKGKSLPDWLVSLIAFLVVMLMLLGIVEIVRYNLELIISSLPIYIQNSKNMLQNLQTIEGYEAVFERVSERFIDFDFRPILTDLLNALSNIAGNLFMIIIYVIFLLAEEKYFDRKMQALWNDSKKLLNFYVIVQQINEAIRIYLSVKTQMSVLTGLLSYFILLAFQVDFPVLWAFLIFLFNYIPYVGSFVATLLPSLFAMFQFQSYLLAIWIFLAIQVVQVLVGNILEPKVMGRTLNLSPLGVLLALTFWGIIWGVLGMILSVPITSILVIILSRFPDTRFIAIWFSESGELGDLVHQEEQRV